MAADRESVRLTLRLLTAARLVERRIDQVLRAQFGATIARFDFLAALDRHGPQSLGEISQRLLVSNGNVTGLAARLRADGLIETKEGQADRRFQHVALTRHGARVFGKMADAHAACVEALVAPMPAAERRALMVLLDSAKDAIRASLDASSEEETDARSRLSR